jgi:AraC family transcriptional regulator
MRSASPGLSPTISQHSDGPSRNGLSVRFDRPTLTAVLARLADLAHEEFTSDQPLADKFIARVTTFIRTEMEREEAEGHSLSSRGVQLRLAPWQARRALEYIEINLDRTIRVEELASVTQLSTRHFSRAFRGDFGLSPYAYFTRQRIKRAQELLLFADKPLASIAISCGFTDQSHLSRLFRQIVGMTPGRWRRSRRAA